jgi:8-oxo-dGTP diphosphatase
LKLFVLGFLFRSNGREVALIQKNRPEWQRGSLNGIGGRVESGETPLAAMIREFSEEAGANVSDWRNFGVLSSPDTPMAVALYVSHAAEEIVTKSDEPVAWYELLNLANLKVIPNLRWIIPAAMENGQFIIARCER